MKILITIYEGMQFGGAEVSTETLIKGLQKQGHEVLVASARDWGAVAKTFKFWDFRLKLPIFYLQEIYLKRFLKKVIKENNIDLVHAQDRLTTAAAVKAAKTMDIASVISFRDYWPVCPNSSCCDDKGNNYDKYGFAQLVQEPLKRIPWNFYKMLELARIRRVLKKADCSMPISGAVYQKFTISANSFVIPITRDLSSFLRTQRTKSDKKRILFVGNLAYNKGIITILDWMPNFLLEHPDCEFTIVGDGELRKDVLKIIKGHKQIKYLGKVSHEKMPDIYSNSDILLFPSLWIEPFGGVVIEAMASGVAVIATAYGGYSDYLGGINDGAYSDIDDFELILNKLINSNFNHLGDNAFNHLGDNARKVIKSEYNLGKIFKKINGCYDFAMIAHDSIPLTYG